MGSAALGKGTSDVRISNLTPNGFSFRVGSEELFVSFGLFPWFRDATIGQITRVEAASENDLYWPDLDFDLSAESIRHPEQFPLVSKVRS